MQERILLGETGLEGPVRAIIVDPDLLGGSQTRRVAIPGAPVPGWVKAWQLACPYILPCPPSSSISPPPHHLSHTHHTTPPNHPKSSQKKVAIIFHNSLKVFVAVSGTLVFQLFTMSSVSSTASSMSSTSTVSSSRPSSSSKYRVAEYYDGQVLRIHESRRRPHVTSLAKSTSSARHERPIGAYASLLPIAEPNSNAKGTDHGDRSNKHGSRMISHVTTATHISPKAKPVIIQSPLPLRTLKKGALPVFEDSDIPTPPQTPKMQRLATPEIEEWDDSPFCDCCADMRFIKFCTSCGSKLHSL